MALVPRQGFRTLGLADYLRVVPPGNQLALPPAGLMLAIIGNSLQWFLILISNLGWIGGALPCLCQGVNNNPRLLALSHNFAPGLSNCLSTSASSQGNNNIWDLQLPIYLLTIQGGTTCTPYFINNHNNFSKPEGSVTLVFQVQIEPRAQSEIPLSWVYTQLIAFSCTMPGSVVKTQKPRAALKHGLLPRLPTPADILRSAILPAPQPNTVHHTAKLLAKQITDDSMQCSVLVDNLQQCLVHVTKPYLDGLLDMPEHVECLLLNVPVMDLQLGQLRVAQDSTMALLPDPNAIDVNAMVNRLTYAEGCAGMSGFRHAAKNLRMYRNVSFDVDQNVMQHVQQIAPDGRYVFGDATDPRWFPKLRGAQLYVAGYPCQPFSGAGMQLGMDDSRFVPLKWLGVLLWSMGAHACLLENVKKWYLAQNNQETPEHILVGRILESFGFSLRRSAIIEGVRHIPQERTRAFTAVTRTGMVFNANKWEQDLNALPHIYPSLTSYGILTDLKEEQDPGGTCFIGEGRKRKLFDPKGLPNPNFHRVRIPSEASGTILSSHGVQDLEYQQPWQGTLIKVNKPGEIGNRLRFLTAAEAAATQSFPKAVCRAIHMVTTSAGGHILQAQTRQWWKIIGRAVPPPIAHAALAPLVHQLWGVPRNPDETFLDLITDTMFWHDDIEDERTEDIEKPIDILRFEQPHDLESAEEATDVDEASTKKVKQQMVTDTIWAVPHHQERQPGWTLPLEKADPAAGEGSALKQTQLDHTDHAAGEGRNDNMKSAETLGTCTHFVALHNDYVLNVRKNLNVLKYENIRSLESDSALQKHFCTKRECMYRKDSEEPEDGIIAAYLMNHLGEESHTQLQKEGDSHQQPKTVLETTPLSDTLPFSSHSDAGCTPPVPEHLCCQICATRDLPLSTCLNDDCRATLCSEHLTQPHVCARAANHACTQLGMQTIIAGTNRDESNLNVVKSTITYNGHVLESGFFRGYTLEVVHEHLEQSTGLIRGEYALTTRGGWTVAETSLQLADPYIQVTLDEHKQCQAIQGGLGPLIAILIETENIKDTTVFVYRRQTINAVFNMIAERIIKQYPASDITEATLYYKGEQLSNKSRILEDVGVQDLSILHLANCKDACLRPPVHLGFYSNLPQLCSTCDRRFHSKPFKCHLCQTQDGPEAELYCNAKCLTKHRQQCKYKAVMADRTDLNAEAKINQYKRKSLLVHHVKQSNSSGEDPEWLWDVFVRLDSHRKTMTIAPAMTLAALLKDIQRWADGHRDDIMGRHDERLICEWSGRTIAADEELTVAELGMMHNATIHCRARGPPGGSDNPGDRIVGS